MSRYVIVARNAFHADSVGGAGDHARVGLGTFLVIRTCLDIIKTFRGHFWKNENVMFSESQMSISVVAYQHI